MSLTIPKIIEQSGFDVVGISTRTNNAKEIGGNGAIALYWERFMKEGVAARVPNRASDTIYALYSGYAKDRNSDYDFIIGVRITSSDGAIAPGMIRVHVPGGRYAVITSGKGPGFQVVPAAWQRVWQLEDTAQLGGIRAYATDFEVYDHRAHDPQAAQVDLYVGLK